MLQEIVKSEKFMLMQFFYRRCSIRKGGVHLSKQKVTLRIEEGEVELLIEKDNTDNQSEAIRLAIMESLATEDLEKVKTLFLILSILLYTFFSSILNLMLPFSMKHNTVVS